LHPFFINALQGFYNLGDNMDTLVTGKKGSGKTYYAVYHISTLSKEEQSKVIHNVDGLKIGRTFQSYCEEKGISELKIWSNSYHDVDNGGTDDLHGALFVFDECQHLFDTYFKDPDVLKFFQMSRHYNIDIILLSQDYKLICAKIALHAELHLKAVPDIANPIPGFFVYNEMSGYEQVGQRKLRKSKKVFSLYKSANYSKGGERKKIKPMQKLFIVACLGVALALFLAFRFFGGFGDGKKITNPDSSSQYTPDNPPPEPTYRKKKNSSSDNFSDSQDYPVSIVDKLSGIPLPVSTYIDKSGLNVFLLGVVYRLNDFPFPVVTSKLGYIALVPQDVYTAAQQYKTSLTLESNYDPNSKYYYHGDTSSPSDEGNL
jgi:hypothetical protein